MSKKSYMDIIFILVCVCMTLTKYAKCTTLGQGYELGKKLPMTSVMVLEKIGQQMCFKECEAYGACLSINYNRGQLVCELNSGRQNNNLSLINDDDYIYKEIPRAANKTCGNVTCNSYSKCVRTAFRDSVCIPFEAIKGSSSEIVVRFLCPTGSAMGQLWVCFKSGCVRDPEPPLENRIIVNRTYVPPSITYGCSPGFTSVGSKNVITCVPGQKWETRNYTCEDRCSGVLEVYEERPYCFINETATWDDAVQTCNSSGGHLVEIENLTEQNWIISKMISSNENMWIGLTDRDSEGTWYWINSRKEPIFTDWSPPEPSGGTSEIYAVLSLISKKWYDVPTNFKATILCEI